MISVYPIHLRPELIPSTAILVSSQWPRSLQLREESLKKSKDELPCALILTIVEDQEEKVIGHSLISSVSLMAQGNQVALIESVVIDKKYRGKGYGSILMQESEKFILSLGFNNLYLSTKDKESFYKNLGFSICDAPSLSKCKISFLKEESEDELESNKEEKIEQQEVNEKVMNEDDQATDSFRLPPPPPPPTPILSPQRNPDQLTWMKKEL